MMMLTRFRFPCQRFVYAYFAKAIQSGKSVDVDFVDSFFSYMNMTLPMEDIAQFFVNQFKELAPTSKEIESLAAIKLNEHYIEYYRNRKYRQFMDAAFMSKEIANKKIIHYLQKFFRINLIDKQLENIRKLFFDYDELSYHEVANWFEWTKTNSEALLLSQVWLGNIDVLLHSLGENVDLSPVSVFNTLFQDCYFTYKELMARGDFKEAREWMKQMVSLITKYESIIKQNKGSSKNVDWESKIMLLSKSNNRYPTIEDITK